MQTSNVLIKPVVSEKAVRVAGSNQYAFIVDSDAHKGEIKKAVEQHYEVDVIRVTTTKFRTSPRRQTRRRIENPGSLQKKAYVTLKEGQSLDLLGTSEE